MLDFIKVGGDDAISTKRSNMPGLPFNDRGTFIMESISWTYDSFDTLYPAIINRLTISHNPWSIASSKGSNS